METNTEQGVRRAARGIMDQCMYAVGAGGSPQWVFREALGLIRDRYFPAILQAVKAGHEQRWTENAPHVLHWMCSIGQLAGNLALDCGRHRIQVEDVEIAILKVEANYDIESSGGSQGGVSPSGEGVWCPPPKG